MSQKNSTSLQAYIGLGSNLGEPVAQIYQARQCISDIPGVKETAFSSLFSNPPMGPADQPDYVNAVMALQTAIPASALLVKLQAIENAQGRVRNGQRWGARTLDLDLLLYGEQKIALPDLIVPHPGIADRAFVLLPLCEIAPELMIPDVGLVKNLCADCDAEAMIKIQ